jgi:hypothetical protein
LTNQLTYSLTTLDLADAQDDVDDDALMELLCGHEVDADDLNPTPIDQSRISVVTKVSPEPSLLSKSELLHLQNLVTLLNQTPLPAVPSSCSSSSATPSLVCEDYEDDYETSSSSTTSSKRPAIKTPTWKERFEQLMEFRAVEGHVNVPYDYAQNPPLAQWVKRQRHQRKLLEEGRHSNLSPSRLEQLQSIGFCWDSRQAHWLDRFYELRSFQQEHGHVRVSKRQEATRSLAVWLKRQRHQGRLFLQGKPTGNNMSQEWLTMLLRLGVKFS